MIRNRQFMFGLGIGLIAGALLLQAMLIGQLQTGKLQTREQIERAAASLNLKVVADDQELLTEEEWRAKSEEALSEQSDADSKLNETETITETETPSQPVTPYDPVPPAQTDQPVQEPVSVQYTIVSGSTLSEVAEGLYNAGVISDKDKFLEKAKAKQINYKIKTGTYTFEIGEDHDTIISKISPGTSKNK